MTEEELLQKTLDGTLTNYDEMHEFLRASYNKDRRKKLITAKYNDIFNNNQRLLFVKNAFKTILALSFLGAGAHLSYVGIDLIGDTFRIWGPILLSTSAIYGVSVYAIPMKLASNEIVRLENLVRQKIWEEDHNEEDEFHLNIKKLIKKIDSNIDLIKKIQYRGYQDDIKLLNDLLEEIYRLSKLNLSFSHSAQEEYMHLLYKYYTTLRTIRNNVSLDNVLRFDTELNIMNTKEIKEEVQETGGKRISLTKNKTES